MASTEALGALARPLLASAGLRLWDVEIGGDVVRVLVDRDGGVDLDALTDASRVVSGLLDDHDELVPTGRYQLEVSSPGLERALRTEQQFSAYLGTTVTVKTDVAIDGARRHRGVLHTVDGLGIDLISDTDPDGPPLAIPYDRIERAHTVLDWGPAPKPGSRPKAANRRSTPPSPQAATTGTAEDKDRSR